MATPLGELPLVVIVGPTASGKTAAAIEVAKRHNGEVIAADSRTVYTGMDVGTAKPTVEERGGAVHWGFDLIEPGQRFTAAEFQRYALGKIDDIRHRGKLPIMVGGTGLYVDSVIFDYQFPDPPSDKVRQSFEAMSIEELYKYCSDNNIELPINDKNKRHLVHAAVRNGLMLRRKNRLIDNTIVVGIATEKAILEQRFMTRAEQMFDDGVVEEAKLLGKKYGWDSEAMTGNIYPLVHEYVLGNCTLEESQDAFVVRDRQLAKRQMTWFRRNPWIIWHKSDQIAGFVSQALDTRTQI